MGSVHEFPDSSTIAREAREWLIRLDSEKPLSSEESESLRRWFQRSPAHVRELKRILAFWSSANILTELAVPLKEFTECQAAGRPRRKWLLPSFFREPKGILAAVVLGVACGLFWWLMQSPGSFNGLYATGVGQQQSVSLPDGSSIQVNTDSQVQVAFDEARRRVRLLRGEAHFDVEHDPNRPFEVFVGDSMVEAVGTAFSVYVRDSEVRVTVVEGRVALNAVQPGPVAPDSGVPALQHKARTLTSLGAGQKATLNRMTEELDVRTLAEQELTREMSWRSGYLVFSGQPLGYVVGEVSRYTPYTIDIEDPNLKSLPIGGRFKVGDLEGVFEVLHSSFGIEVVHLGDQHVQLQAARGH